MSQDPFAGLREKLHELDWPRVYLFKFIVPSAGGKIEEAEALFNPEFAKIERRPSKTGKFVSISVKEMMMNPDKVIERYEKATKIEGLISL
jgi:putative lipoic acid-binding regulatory protein